MESTRAFFEGLNQREDTRAALADLDQTVRFLVQDGEPFRIEVSGGVLTFVEGAGEPEAKTTRTSRTSRPTARPSAASWRERSATRTP